MKLNDFLVNYYMQMHFNDMPAEVRAQFKKYAEADDFRGNMKKWKTDLMDNQGASKPLPDAMDPNIFEQADWEKFFNAFQNALRGMDANKKSFKDNEKAKKFLEEYFGDGKMFTIGRANPENERAIATLTSILRTHKTHLSIWLKQNGNLFETDADYNEFLDGLTTKKYNSDVKFQEKLKAVSSYLSYGRGNFTNQTKLEEALEQMGGSLDGIKAGFETSSIDPARLQSFRDEYPMLLRRLYKEDKTLEAFANNDNGKISSPLKEALEKTDFGNKDSKDFVPPKRTDELTLNQQLSDWVGNTYSDSLEKYIKLRSDRLYVSPNAQAIVGALDKAKIKPTDGLEKILSEGSKIKEKLLYKSPKATEAFEYFLKIMGELKETMPKAFAGALQNGHQLRALVEEMSLSAVKNGKVEQAKVAMEILSVIKYGYTTSKIMDAIGKEKMTIFSDPGLSWNKTEGVKFVTTAFDKSMKAAFMGVGYAITITGNAIKRSGNKFNGQSDRMKNARNNLKNQNNADHTKLQNEQTADTQRLNAANANLAQARAQGIDENTPREKEEDVRQSNDLKNHIELLDEINQVNTWINNPINAAKPEMAQRQSEYQQLQDYLNDKKQVTDSQILALQAWVNDPANAGNPDLPEYRQNLVQLHERKHIQSLDLPTAQTEFTNLETNMVSQRQRVDEFNNAIDEVNFLTKQTETRDATLNSWDEKHKDQYLELMAHWDFIETGSKVHTWSLGTKNTRKKFDATKKNQLDAWQADYQNQYTV